MQNKTIENRETQVNEEQVKEAVKILHTWRNQIYGGIVKCAYCGEEFYAPLAHRRKYCSSQCKSLDYYYRVIKPRKEAKRKRLLAPPTSSHQGGDVF